MRSLLDLMGIKAKVAAIAAGILMVGYICLLVSINYFSQIELRESTLKQLRQDMKRRATTVDYFCSERKNDLKNLPATYLICYLNDFPEAICFPRKAECYRADIATLLGMTILGKIKTNKIYSITPKLFGLPLLNPKIVQTFHSYDAQVIAFLPETTSETQQCIDAGVD